MNIVISRREKLLEQIEKEGACMQEKQVQGELKWREIMGMGGVGKNFSSNKAFN